MSVNINADTTNGLVLTSDTSGELKLQSAGADIATVTSSGITMASGKTLPASALTGTVPSSSVDALSTASGSAPSYSARAWVNFNGIGTVAIRDSENVTSITDQGTGDYFVNFTTNMQSSGHSYVGCCNEEGGNPHFCNPTQGTSAGFRIRVFLGTTNAAADVSIINFAVFD